MELRKIENKTLFYPKNEVSKVALRRFLIALAIVLVVGGIIWLKMKS